MNLTGTQRAELRHIAEGGHDMNRNTGSLAFREGRDHARSRLRDVLDTQDDDAFEESAIEVDAESCLFEGEFSFGFLSVLDDVRVVLPSWPWLPGVLAEGAKP